MFEIVGKSNNKLISLVESTGWDPLCVEMCFCSCQKNNELSDFNSTGNRIKN